MRDALEAVQDSPSSSSVAHFTAAHRLLRKDRFDHVIHAENIANRYFKIFFSCNDKNNSRLGIISSKKILPEAVDRNRARRLIREAFRQHNIKTCKLDLVVMVRPAYAQESRKLNDSLVTLLDRVEDRWTKS
jgi:ribonuclease P protein component